MWLLLFALLISSGDAPPVRSPVEATRPPSPLPALDPQTKFPEWDIAYAARVNDKVGVYLMSDGKSTVLTPDFGYASMPSWSPDGTKLAFEGKRGNGNCDIYVLTLASGKINRLTINKAADVWPVWSPDGNTIAFQSTRGPGEVDDVHLMDSAGRNVRRLTLEIRDSRWCAWSPDSELIAFCAPEKPNTSVGQSYYPDQIFVVRADGTKLKQLTSGKPVNSCPAWSPDGKRIMFSSNRLYNDLMSLAEIQIFSMATDGSDIKQLTNFAGQSVGANWSPDGRKIVFHSAERTHRKEIWKNTGEICVMDADGTQILRLTDNDWDEYFPVFRPGPLHGSPRVESK